MEDNPKYCPHSNTNFKSLSQRVPCHATKNKKKLTHLFIFIKQLFYLFILCPLLASAIISRNVSLLSVQVHIKSEILNVNQKEKSSMLPRKIYQNFWIGLIIRILRNTPTIFYIMNEGTNKYVSSLPYYVSIANLHFSRMGNTAMI